MRESDEIKVLIVNEEGLYLSGTATQWEFTEDRARARVFDYLGDHVAALLHLVRNASQAIWIAVKLDPREAYEFCDRCGARMTAAQARYDGTQFYCPGCAGSGQETRPIPGNPR